MGYGGTDLYISQVGVPLNVISDRFHSVATFTDTDYNMYYFKIVVLPLARNYDEISRKLTVK